MAVVLAAASLAVLGACKRQSVSAGPMSWQRLEASAPGGRFLDIRRPAETYPSAEVRVYLHQGKPAIGLFRPVKADLPAQVAAMTAELRDVRSLRVDLAKARD